MYCRKCKYDLRGTTSGSCPECGQPFSRDDPRTYRLKPRWSWTRRGVVAAGVLAALALLAGPAVYGYPRAEYAIDRHRAARVTAGMDEQQVLNALGEPTVRTVVIIDVFGPQPRGYQAPSWSWEGQSCFCGGGIWAQGFTG